ncbi:MULTISPECIES: hypothetical protein, partial [unclassified Rhizobium]|uniref:hypothetical protein n=1 Tax=unclassified Rhizobium TaxID=2613769 RepID=UPI001ADCC830
PPDIPSSLNPPQISKTIESRQPGADNAQFFNSIRQKRTFLFAHPVDNQSSECHREASQHPLDPPTPPRLGGCPIEKTAYHVAKEIQQLTHSRRPIRIALF